MQGREWDFYHSLEESHLRNYTFKGSLNKDINRKEWNKNNVLIIIAPGAIIKDGNTAIMMKALPEILRDNIIKHCNGKKNYTGKERP